MPGADQMHMGDRPMTGFIAVDEEATADDDALRTGSPTPRSS